MADSHAPNHQYHLVDPSPWPIVGSIGALLMAAVAWHNSLGTAAAAAAAKQPNFVVLFVDVSRETHPREAQAPSLAGSVL